MAQIYPDVNRTLTCEVRDGFITKHGITIRYCRSKTMKLMLNTQMTTPLWQKQTKIVLGLDKDFLSVFQGKRHRSVYLNLKGPAAHDWI